MITTHCALRLGDGLAALHFLRKLALANTSESFVHYAHAVYIPQLMPLTEGVEIELRPLDQNGNEVWWLWKPPVPSMDLWKNAGGYWENSPIKFQYAAVMLEFFALRAREMGLDSPLKTPADLLLDYPALRADENTLQADFLIVNSTAMSGQCAQSSPDEMERLILELSHKYKVITTQRTRVPVTCTQDLNLDVTEIGRISQRVKFIIMNSTGPSWPTLNTWNVDSISLRIILVDQEVICMSKNTYQRLSASGAEQVLSWKGIL